jgi:F0F1-type ATP synthase membrane subunit c/vacuolar-type H+-ATPase subunit K
MEASLKMLRTVRLALLVALLVYVFVGERIPHTPKPTNPAFYYTTTFMAVGMIVSIFLLRRVMVIRAEQTLVKNAEDSVSLYRWRAGYIVTFALCEAIALYGFVLRFLFFSLTQVMPFYVVGFVLLLFFRPRRPSNEIG